MQFKHKLGIMVVSNRPGKLSAFSTAARTQEKLNEIAVYGLVHQDPVCLIPTIFKYAFDLEPFDKTKPLPMLQLRRHGLNLLRDCEYIICLDDDHRFQCAREGKKFGMSTEDYYLSSLKYMEDNPDIGVLSQRGYFGGFAWGYNIVKNPKNGLIENNAGGIMLRNIGADKIFPVECHNFVGVMSEPLMGYNIINHGYNYAKRFNCPNKFDVPGSKKHVGIRANISYSEEVANQNAQGYIRFKFHDPTWRHSDKKYPKLIAEKLGVKQ